MTKLRLLKKNIKTKNTVIIFKVLSQQKYNNTTILKYVQYVTLINDVVKEVFGPLIMKSKN